VRRKYEALTRRDQRLAHGEKKARAANAIHVTELTAGTNTASPYIPSSASPLKPWFFSDHGGATPRFSLH
jgi:hypothetical protein